MVVESLSYSGGTGRSFGSKSPQKKDRKKKQEFHKHKLKFTEEEHPDFEQLKSRVSAGLDRLGHQVFSLEPGGYSFENWMTSFNLLLDDFEEKVGPTNLPKEYYDSRQNFTSDLVKPAETQDIDWEIQNLETEIESVKTHLSEYTRRANEKKESRRETAAKIEHLKREQELLENKIGEALQELDKAKKKQSFFSRVLSSSKDSPVDSAKKNVDTLKSTKEEIEGILQELQTDSEDASGEFEHELAVLEEKLRALQQSEAEFVAKKNEKSQLVERRIETTTALAQIISSLKLDAVEEKASD